MRASLSAQRPPALPAPGGTMRPITVDIALCTFRRPGVAATIASLQRQVLPPGVSCRILVVDNDATPSGRAQVMAGARQGPFQVIYRHVPAGNISVARNACLDRANADWVAFIDDDEIAAAGWLAGLLRAAAAGGCDAVFGPTRAQYPADAPDWIIRYDHLSNRPGRARRGGLAAVATGHTCNALLRWRGTPWTGARFELSRGLSGGEDTEFFARLARAGARLGITERADVFETVPAERLSFAWLRRRKFRMGQSHAGAARGIGARGVLLVTAGGKCLICLGAGVLTGLWTGPGRYWLLRATLHAGVCAGCLSLPQAPLYGYRAG